MNRILKIACLVQLGLFHIAHATTLPAFITHVHLLQELKDHFNLLGMKITYNIQANVAGEKKLTQTEAYLKRYKAEVESAFADQLKEHKGLIDQVLAREKELADTHYFFYHAHLKELIILHDFIKLLNGYMHIVFPRTDFTCMRFKNTLELPYKNVNEYLDANPYINDNYDPARSQMLSVNLALFGNHEGNGSCTFEYFLKDSSCFYTNLQARLEPIFSHYGFNTKYLTELTDLTSYLTSSTGNLLQICIPHDMVDDLVYLAKTCGPVYTKVVLEKYYDQAKNRHTCIRPLLEHMCTHPEKIDGLKYWQARLMFFDPMVDMHPAIKVFRYNTITPKNMALYQQKLKDIVVRIVCDYLKSLTGTTPLARLYQYAITNTDFVAIA